MKRPAGLQGAWHWHYSVTVVPARSRDKYFFTGLESGIHCNKKTLFLLLVHMLSLFLIVKELGNIHIYHVL